MVENKERVGIELRKLWTMLRKTPGYIYTVLGALEQ